MKLSPIFKNYEILVDKAESAFHKVRAGYGEYVRCELHCSDCCHAVFGLFLVEAAYIREHFETIDEAQKRQALLRCDRADEAFEKLQAKLKTFEHDPHMQAYTLARERIPCPLLDEQNECVLYHRRPITCRVYGIPTKIQGKARVCGKTGFEDKGTYPVFDLDNIYRDLYLLSRELLTEAGSDDPDRASLLISVSKTIQTPLDKLLHEDLKK
ncbi:MAG: YkgJ family cysteine cluster protein [Deltaproteobacteria bacterium]|nr:YkgJ family cysteine cluster protein [Deltaproteobacteria bacterium]